MGKRSDKALGMQREISRRDVLHGLGAAAAASFVPSATFAAEVLAAERAGQLYYPPSLMGMRGNHDGSFEVGHALARDGKHDFGKITEPDAGVYDLIVVGAGISGLAAAHFYLKERPDARVLLLDNHDDFGGHAKRNEFQAGGRTWLGYGGSQTLQEPNFYPAPARTLLDDLGINIKQLGDAYDQSFFKRNGLGVGIHFDKQQWGVDRVLPWDLGALSYMPFAESKLSPEELVTRMPISEPAQREFLRLLTTKENQLDMPEDERYEYMYSVSYRTFLEDVLDIHEPEVFKILGDLTLDMGSGVDSTPAGVGVGYNGLPGAEAAGVDGYVYQEPYIHHFPDGNACVARLMVRNMIPGVSPGSNMEDIVQAPFDYSKLDVATAKVRLRLNSTAIKVVHDGDPKTAKTVAVEYVQHGKASRVRGKHCVLACFNNIIPAMCPELPEDQRAALKNSIRSPILYTSVALNNWRAWKQLGIGGATASGLYHPLLMMDFPVSFGGQDWSDDPDSPMIVHMERFPHANGQALPMRDHLRVGRAELLSTPFEEMERKIRYQLTSLLSGGDFDPARDIAGITVNRWAHGYAWGADDMDSGDTKTVRSRQPFGRITIANSDAGGSAMLESAVVQAHRAVGEIS